uniref:Uncharacterized protein n=1 Tax=Virgibacillus oceani TaxID=1479511 RepID=A0A917H235_9BACI|nr:hypothetical protein GCM10011398_05000 [Virgibacillus oceani]
MKLLKHYNVTEEFLEESLKYYRDKYGTQARIDNDHVLYLDPLSIHKDIK